MTEIGREESVETSTAESPLAKQSKKHAGGVTKSSWVWSHIIDLGDKAECTLCKKKLIRNPTTLERHLDGVHKDLQQKFAADKLTASKRKQASEKSKSRPGSSQSYSQITILESFKACDKYPPSHPKQQEREKALALLLTATSLPISTVSLDQFRNFVAVLDRRFQIPTRQSAVKKIKDLVSALKAKVKELLSNSVTCSICVDMWSQPNLSSSVVGVTRHFLLKCEQEVFA